MSHPTVTFKISKESISVNFTKIIVFSLIYFKKGPICIPERTNLVRSSIAEGLHIGHIGYAKD